MKIGIDKIGFFTPNMYVDMVDLAHARGEDPNKYLIGIGQEKQSVIPNTQDVVTMAANATHDILDNEDIDKIDLIVFGTETGVDNSKSAAIYLQQLMNLNSNARAFEIKQACYGATAGLQMAKDYIANHPEKRALVIGSDIARYGLKTPGEVTQGGGAIAMIISSNPDIVTINEPSTFYSKDIMDFWRPLYRTEAVVDGHYSNEVYINFFNNTWQQYKKLTGNSIDDFKSLIFHLPYPKMGLKALRKVLPETSEERQNQLFNQFKFSSKYNQLVGNLYTGSLYLSLLSLIDNSDDLKVNDKIGLFSYGSGAQGEFFSGTLQSGFKDLKRKQQLTDLIDQRKKLTIDQYEKVFNDWLPIKEENIDLDFEKDSAHYILKGVNDHKRIYGTH